MKNLDKKNILVEILNSITHGIGVILGIVFLIIMIVQSSKMHSGLSVASFAIYGSFFIFMFLASTIYHATTFTRFKNFFRIFDHSSIFFFIAGSYTPIIINILSGKERIISISLIWAIALMGFLFKIFTYGKYDKYIKVSVLLYIAMGWLAIFLIRPMILYTSFKCVLMIVLGGILYTVGTYFYKQKSLQYSHVVWHCFVLMAAVFQFIGIYELI